MTGDKHRGEVWRGRVKLYALRALSGAFTVGVAYALSAYFGLHYVVLAGIFGFLAFTLPGIGNAMTVFTFWTGYAVTSCPNCPEFGFKKASVITRTCDYCGDEEVLIELSEGAGWWQSHRDGESFLYCTYDCLKSHDSEREAENAA